MSTFMVWSFLSVGHCEDCFASIFFVIVIENNVLCKFHVLPSTHPLSHLLTGHSLCIYYSCDEFRVSLLVEINNIKI